MHAYRSKYSELKGTDSDELTGIARYEYHMIQKRTPERVAYVRSRYFNRDKIFINNFWEHLNQKSPKERVRRLRLYACAIDLIRNSNYAPDTIYTHTDVDIGLHRFYGQTKNGTYFCVQIKQNKRNNRKDFISAFPIKIPR
jgi:hypothetical protein